MHSLHKVNEINIYRGGHVCPHFVCKPVYINMLFEVCAKPTEFSSHIVFMLALALLKIAEMIKWVRQITHGGDEKCV
jgi:hypothetical protein